MSVLHFPYLLLLTKLSPIANPIDAPLTPFLRLLDTSKLAMITILELMRLHGSGGVSEGMKTSRALVSVGRSVETECLAVWSKKRGIKLEDVASAPRILKAKKGKQPKAKSVAEEILELRANNDGYMWFRSRSESRTEMGSKAVCMTSCVLVVCSLS